MRWCAPELTFDLTLIDVAETTAVARIERYRDGVHLFTDCQLLYKFDDGWTIAGKTNHAHE